MAATHHPIVGGDEPIEQPPANLSIPVDVCPHCGKPQRNVNQYHKAWRDGTRPWMVTWVCGSYVILSSRPFLKLSKECITVDM